MHISSAQPVCPGDGSELQALIGVHDVGPAEAVDCLVPRRDAEAGFQGIRDVSGRHLARVLVNDRHQMQELLAHRQAGDVGRLGLVWAGHTQAAQQIRAFRKFIRQGLNGLFGGQHLSRPPVLRSFETDQ